MVMKARKKTKQAAGRKVLIGTVTAFQSCSKRPPNLPKQQELGRALSLFLQVLLANFKGLQPQNGGQQISPKLT
jgi:hypothetical protein